MVKDSRPFLTLDSSEHCESQPSTGSQSLRSCPACGHDNAAEKGSPYSRKEWRIKDCRSCQFVYLENAPSYDELISDLGWTKSHSSEEAARRSAEPMVHKLSTTWKSLRRRYLRRDKAIDLIRRYVHKGPVLDVGCSYGNLLLRLPPDCVPYGIEIEAAIATSANEAVRNRGGRVENADALSGLHRFDEGFFAGITMISFLEHEVQPQQVLSQAYRVLRPCGRLILKVPNFESLNRRFRGSQWCGFRFPDHVNYFTATSLRQMVAKAGLSLVRCRIQDRSPISDSLWMVCEKPAARPSQG